MRSVRTRDLMVYVHNLHGSSQIGQLLFLFQSLRSRILSAKTTHTQPHAPPPWRVHRRSPSPISKRPNLSLQSTHPPSAPSSHASPPRSATVYPSAARGRSSWIEAPWRGPSPSPTLYPGSGRISPTSR